jgi:hypothetical protein
VLCKAGWDVRLLQTEDDTKEEVVVDDPCIGMAIEDIVLCCLDFNFVFALNKSWGFFLVVFCVGLCEDFGFTTLVEDEAVDWRWTLL